MNAVPGVHVDALANFIVADPQDGALPGLAPRELASLLASSKLGLAVQVVPNAKRATASDEYADIRCAKAAATAGGCLMVGVFRGNASAPNMLFKDLGGASELIKQGEGVTLAAWGPGKNAVYNITMRGNNLTKHLVGSGAEREPEPVTMDDLCTMATSGFFYWRPTFIKGPGVSACFVGCELCRPRRGRNLDLDLNLVLP